MRVLSPLHHTKMQSNALGPHCAATRPLCAKRTCVRVRCQPESTSAPVASGDSKAEPEFGRMTYKPTSYSELVTDAANAAQRAMADGLTRLEVEFPAVSGLDSYKGSSDLYIDSNVQLALSVGKQIFEKTGKSTVILLPDEPEYDRSSRMFKSTLEMTDGVSMSHLTEGRSAFMKGVRALFDMQDDSKAPSKATDADVHIVINISTIELLDVEKYSQEVAKDGSTIMFWNCELDTLRSDLGLFGFPPKDLQFRFLSKFKPVFYIRQRDYSKTVNIAPFIINYSGALFREYPGPWQVMLRQDNGEYACVAEDTTRYTLGEVKEELMDAMGLNTEEEGSTMQFLRRGYKTTTWWEDAEAEDDPAWRT